MTLQIVNTVVEGALTLFWQKNDATNMIIKFLLLLIFIANVIALKG